MTVTIPYFTEPSPEFSLAFSRLPVAVVRSSGLVGSDLKPPPPSSRSRPRMNTLVGLGDDAVDEQERLTLPFFLMRPEPPSAPAPPPMTSAPRRPFWLVVCDAIETVFDELIARVTPTRGVY